MKASNYSNPFILGKMIPEEYFCDRQEETQTLLKQIKNGRNVALISPRRLGKSGLIHHCFAQKEIIEHYYTFYVDLYATSSLNELVLNLGSEVYRSLKTRKSRFLEKFFAMVQSLRLGFSIDSRTGDPTFDIGIGDIHTPETTLAEIFAYLEAADKPCIVAIDEFQQIGEYPEKNVEALLRTHIQRCSNSSFIFSGSKRHIMSNMFNSSSKPFYQSAITMGLGTIPKETYTDFAYRLFITHDKEIDRDVIRMTYDRYEGYTWFVQMLMNELFSMTNKGEKCTLEMLPEAEQNILQMQGVSYESTLSMLSIKQRQVLSAIATEGYAQSVTSSLFIKKHRLVSASSLQTALTALLNKYIIVKTNDGYRIEDFFFATWLRTRNT